ncbi:MAG: DUF4177 domain-containing protein [Bacilli bacterium]|jgi:hypothetical protein
MDHWEYKTIVVGAKGFFGGKFTPAELDACLNAEGREGWELVSFTTSNQAYGTTGYGVAVFKRKSQY